MNNILTFLNSFFAIIFPFNIRVKGIAVYYNSLDRMIATLLWKFGFLEGYEMNLFLSYLKEGYVMLDIGANMGVYSLVSSKKIGDKGKIIAFEPDSENLKIFKKSINKNRFNNITVFPFAVSDKNEKIFFEKNTFNSGNHQIRKEKSNVSQKSIDAIKLDDFLKDEKKIDIIKIDIQGAEYFAFNGMKEIVEKFPNLLIFAEYWVYGLKKMGVNPKDYINLLESYGFLIYKINSSKQCLEIMDYDVIRNNVEYEKNYLNFVLSKHKLNY